MNDSPSRFIVSLNFDNKWRETKILSANYRKRPCRSRTFFRKIEAQNQGCGISTDTSVFGVLKHPN